MREMTVLGIVLCTQRAYKTAGQMLPEFSLSRITPDPYTLLSFLVKKIVVVYMIRPVVTIRPLFGWVR